MLFHPSRRLVIIPRPICYFLLVSPWKRSFLLYLNTLIKQCSCCVWYSKTESTACVCTLRPHPARISFQQLISAQKEHDWRAVFVSWWSPLLSISFESDALHLNALSGFYFFYYSTAVLRLDYLTLTHSDTFHQAIILKWKGLLNKHRRALFIVGFGYVEESYF